MKTIGVVEAGFYGAYIALKLADKGHKVIVFDPKDNTQSSALYCQARLHSGMFYAVFSGKLINIFDIMNQIEN